MYAIIETGGKQYTVREGDIVRIERLENEPGDKVTFDKVLFLSDEKGIKIGDPLLKGAAVDAKIVSHGKGKKIKVFKMKSKKGYRRTQGHRQPFTKVQIDSITAKSENAKKN